MLCVKYYWVLIFIAGIFVAEILAGPAGTSPFKVMQPDGSVITLRVIGDEFLSCRQTEDGYTVIKNNDGFFVYAIKDNNDNLSPSNFIVKNIESRTSEENSFLQTNEKNLFHSKQEISVALSMRNQIEELRSERIKKNSLQKKNDTPVNWNVCVLLIEFPDLPVTLSVEQIERLFNEEGFDGGYGSPGSFNDYYKEVSYGKFSISADVFGWFMAPNQYEYYANYQSAFWERSQQLTVSVIDQANASGVDFSKYDNDNNNVIEQVIVIHAGLGAAQYGEEEYIWPHQNGIWSSYSRVVDGMNIESYTMQEELHHNTWTDTTVRQAGIGMYAHEFGHALGLPDLYPYSSDVDNATVGEWCNMASGAWINYGKTPPHLSGWCKESLGWIEPEVITINGNVEINSIAFDETGYKIVNVHSDDSEYFILENRYKEGFDFGLPGSGLLITHIDNDRNHRSSVPRKVDVEEADGKDQLRKGSNRGDDGDVFPGGSNNRTFDAFSFPSSNNHNGDYSVVAISNISDPGPSMTFNAKVIGMVIVSSDIKSGHAPLTIGFSDSSISSEPFTWWSWDFNSDGIIDSEEQNPVYTFENSGQYSISLTAGNENFYETVLLEDYVRVFNGFSALSFEQEDAFALIDSSPLLNLTERFTIEVWIKPQGWGPNEVYGLATIFKKSSITMALQKEASTVFNKQSLSLTIKDENNNLVYYGTPEHSIKLDEWQHIAITFDGREGITKVMLDGIEQELISLGTLNGNIYDNTTESIYLGNSSDKNRAFYGQIDELRIWNYVRSTSETINSKETYVDVQSPGLSGYWKMELGNGTTILDSSPAGHHGTTNSLWSRGKILSPLSDNKENIALPNRYSLSQNFPNPFNPTTKIEFSIPTQAHVTLSVFNILGEEVARIVNQTFKSGSYSFVFNADSFSSGVYFYSLFTIDDLGLKHIITRKMVLLK